MFERFTPRARRVIVVAQEEAKNLHHDFIRPEHLLLGLVQGDGIAATALGQLGVDQERLRAKVEETVERSKREKPGAKIPFSPKAKKALERSLREALRLGHNYIGTEHLVLGTLRVVEDDGPVVDLLGIDANDVRERVTALLPTGRVADVPESPESPASQGAMRLARQLAGSEPLTTGHLLRALITDTASQASRALVTFGVTTESVESRLAEVPLSDTSDAPPGPQIVEIKLGETTTTIGDPELAAALGELSPAELRAALRGVLAARPQQPGTEAGRAS